jgi:hypothetical protein
VTITCTGMVPVNLLIYLPASSPFTAGYSLQDIADAMDELSEVDTFEWGQVKRWMARAILAKNAGTQSAPDFRTLDDTAAGGVSSSGTGRTTSTLTPDA